MWSIGKATASHFLRSPALVLGCVFILCTLVFNDIIRTITVLEKRIMYKCLNAFYKSQQIQIEIKRRKNFHGQKKLSKPSSNH